MGRNLSFELENPSCEPAETDKDRIATGPRTLFAVAPGMTKMHKRRAIKNAGSPSSYEVEWAVAELDGVRCYIHDDGDRITVILSKEDLYP